MPNYDYECNKGHREEHYTTIARRDDARFCAVCGEKMRKLISSYSVIGDLEPYLDANLSDRPVWVRSKRHREQLMRENGVTEKYGKGWQ